MYRAGDRAGDTIDCLLRAHRDVAAARQFFEGAIDLHGVPEKITLDKSASNTIRPMLGFKTFRCARAVIAGIETMHLIKKGQLQCPDGRASSAADKFYFLAF